MRTKALIELRPETELLLCCARSHLDSQRAERIGVLLGEDIDWTYVTRTAIRHRVMPLVYQNLNARWHKAIPEAILNQLQSRFLANTGRALFLSVESVSYTHLRAHET